MPAHCVLVLPFRPSLILYACTLCVILLSRPSPLSMHAHCVLSFSPGPLPLSMHAHCVLVLLSRPSPILLLPLSVPSHSHINLCLLFFCFV